MAIDFDRIFVSALVSRGNDRALAAYANLVNLPDGKTEIVCILLASGLTGKTLERFFFDCFGGDTAAVAQALRGLSNNRLKEIRAMLESPPLGIAEARLALGVDKI